MANISNEEARNKLNPRFKSRALLDDNSHKIISKNSNDVEPALVVELVYTADLKSAGHRPCWFESSQEHQHLERVNGSYSLTNYTNPASVLPWESDSLFIGNNHEKAHMGSMFGLCI